MKRRTEEFEMDGSEIKFQPPTFSKNPIVAAIERCLWRRGDIHLLALTGHPCKPKAMRKALLGIFDEESLKEIGLLVAEAFVTGNDEFVEMVKQALKASDKVCHRDREKLLLEKCLPYSRTLPDGLSPEEIKSRLEEHCNNGREFVDHQWRRLRKALNLPKRKSGRR